MVSCNKVDEAFIVTITIEDDSEKKLLDTIKDFIENTDKRQKEKNYWHIKTAEEKEMERMKNAKQMSLSDIDSSFDASKTIEQEFHTLTKKEEEECPFV